MTGGCPCHNCKVETRGSRLEHARVIVTFWLSTTGAGDMQSCWAAAVAVRRAFGAPRHEQPLTPNMMKQSTALLGLGMQRKRRFYAGVGVAAGLHMGVSSGRQRA